MVKKIVTWVVVADGARARIFSNDGPGKGLTPVPGGVLSGSHEPARDINADRPGRTFDRSGDARHAKEPHTDPHRNAKREFVHSVATYLEKGHGQHAFDRLVLVAPPQALGDLRAGLGNGVRATVSAELNKDLTHLKDHELPEPLGSVLAV